MEKLIDILSKILASIQVVFNGVLSLIFQPLFYLISIIQSIIDVWTAEDEDEEFEGEQQPQQQVTEYPSANAGRPYPEECDPPVCEHKIGYRINQQEQDELEKIKKQLNSNQN